MLDSVLVFLDRGLLDAAWWQIVAYTLVVTHVTIVAVTVYLHRCQAHRALELHPLAFLDRSSSDQYSISNRSRSPIG